MSLPEDTLMSVDRSPAYARRRLRVELRRLREHTRPALTQRMVGERLGWSPSKLMRIEKGHVRVRQTDLEALLRLYGVEDGARSAALLAWQRTGRSRASLTDPYRKVLSKVFADYLEEEEAASTIRGYEPTLIPGPLQTPAYARAVMSRFAVAEPDGDHEGDDGEDLPADALEQRVAARMLRQRFLTDRRGLDGVFVITETALRLWVGNEPDAGRRGPRLMIEQLEHLRRLNREYDNIQIRVMPDSAGLFSPYMLFPFVVLEFDDGELLMLLEAMRESEMIRDDSAEVGRVRDAFQAMTELAAPAGSLDAVLDAAIARFRAA
jgi:hypothetical protein